MKRLRWFLIPAISLAALYFVSIFVLRWKYGQGWKSTVAEYESHGFSLDYKDFLPAPVPEGENFAAIPALIGLTVPGNESFPQFELSVENPEAPDEYHPDFAQPIPFQEWVHYLTGPHPEKSPESQRFETHTPPPPEPDPTPAEITESAKIVLRELDTRFGEMFAATDASLSRPRAQFIPSPFENLDPVVPVNSLTNGFLNVSVSYTKTLLLRAAAAAQTGDAPTAKSSILTILRIAEHETFDPFGVALSAVKQVHYKFAAEALEAALAHKLFSEADLVQIQSAFVRSDFLEDHIANLQIDAITICTSLAAFHDGRSSIHSDQTNEEILRPEFVDQVRSDMLHAYLHCLLIPALDRDIPAMQDNYRDFLKASVRAKYRTPFMLMDYYCGLAPFYTRWLADSSAIACALERHRLASGTYPDSLDALVPRYLEKVPPDPIDLQPLRYRHTPDSTSYLLYSIGWDLIDDLGESDDNPEHYEIRQQEGDWAISRSALPSP